MKKQMIIVLITILVVIALVLCIGLGIKNSKRDENTDNSEKNEIEKVEEKADEDTEKIDEISEININQAIDYIKVNMNIPIEEIDSEVISDIAYYGSYLKKLGEKYSVDSENEIFKLGENALEYAKEISGKTVEELLAERDRVERTKEIVNDIETERITKYDELKGKVTDSINQIEENKENLIKEFNKKIKKDENTENIVE